MISSRRMHNTAIYLMAFFVVLIGLASIIGSGGGDGNDYTPPPIDPACNIQNQGGWITVTEPSTCPSETESPAPYIYGGAFVSSDWFHCCSGSATDTGVTVTWRNQTTGVSGNTTQRVRYCWFFTIYLCDHTWAANIPLVMGENRLTVSAADPSNHQATATITIVRKPETIPPTIVSTSPENAQASVSPNQVITATFSEELTPTTLNANTFYLRDNIGTPVTGTVTYAATTATFTPASDLAYSTTYIATISNEVKDLSGNAMVQVYSWTFTTGAEPDTSPPTVSMIDPADGEICVPLDNNISVTFSEAMDASTLNASSFQLTDLSFNPISGGIRNTTTSSTFTPFNNLAYETGYRAVLTTGIKDLAGNTLASDYSWTFTTVPTGGGAWTTVSTTNAPSYRYGHSAIWTGSEMIIWGGGWNGVSNTGGRYNPPVDAWQPTGTNNAPSPRMNHTAVWTGDEMIIWGGYANPIWLNTGGRYDPLTDTWQSINTDGAPSPRRYHTTVWTGSEMIIWGGNDASQTYNDGARYLPGTDTWLPMSSIGAPQQLYGNYNAETFWTGSEMLLWDRTSVTGGRYNPVTDTWSPISTAGAPTTTPQSEAVVWTGTEILIWGSDYFGAYNPVTNTWRQLPTTCAPSTRTDSTAVWAGNEMIIWGGKYGNFELDSGAKYQQSHNAWTLTTLVNAPSPRYQHTAVWTGTDMIIWGGTPDGTGGKYTP